MPNHDHIDLLKKGVAAWRKWRQVNPDVRPDLSRAKLSMAHLDRMYLLRADLSGAELNGAGLEGADLNSAKLSKAHLDWANLKGADLFGAVLSEAILREAELGRARLTGADLSGADLSGANLSEADLTGANLSTAKLDFANFGRANLFGASLSNAKLGRARLTGAGLSRANLSGANLIRADLSYADLGGANLSGANLSGANLSGAQLVDTDFTGADLTGCRVYGVSAWRLKLERAKQRNLVITPEEEPQAIVDDLEVAQFFYLLLHREKIRNVIDAVTRRGVLFLGRFGEGGLDVLQAIAAWLRRPENGGYLPLLFDFPRPEAKTYTETVRTLVSLARFVIVDLSGPSVPQEISATVDLYEIPFVPILEQKRKDRSMFKDFLIKDRVLDPVRFTDQDQLLELLGKEVIAPAEKLIEKRQQRLDKIFGRA